MAKQTGKLTQTANTQAQTLPAATAAPGVKVLGKAGYARLLTDSQGILQRGQGQAQRAVSKVLVQTYWELGTRILGERMTDRAGYGRGVVQELAIDLGLSRALMFRVVSFARLYKEAPQPGLTWSQYTDLLGVKSDEARAHYEAMARADNWTRPQLQAAIRQGTFALAEDNRPSTQEKNRLPRPTEAEHLYRVDVTRIIDGDTVVVDIDLGFDVIRRQKMRLALVNAAEAHTTAGRAATVFVRERLATAEVVAVKTVRSEDAHGRYVGHLFYGTTPGTVDDVFRRGRHLNSELLEHGFAERAPRK